VADLRFRWNGSDLIPADGASILPLYVADSWLVSEGNVVALEEHFTRFAASCAFQGLVRPVEAFITAVTAALPRTGQVFPRIDLTERGELELWIRPAPALATTIILSTAAQDVRSEPAIKGPDLVALEDLRASAREQGADDSVILTSAGHIIDGATTCLLWWRNGELFTPPAEATRVDSITVKVIHQIAEAHGITVGEEWATPADLADLSVWAVNALHGIRQVSAWIDGPQLTPDHESLESWRESYQALSIPLSER
jgi:branched-subunit amino acid aminotransferase/4-amino-4-deoxychorismate lyase